MDQFVEGFEAVEDGDLMLCHTNGVAYQRDMRTSVPYDAAYFDKYVSYEGQDIALRINAGRVRMVNDCVGASADVLDIGIGSGEFIKSRPHTFGYDINQKAIAWLQLNSLWGSPYVKYFSAYTFWDVLEHVREPEEGYFNSIPSGAILCTSLPIFSDLTTIRQSKHYRPNEHFYYWTEAGFVEWMRLYSFDLIERQDFESKAGRENILSFAFKRK